MKITDSLFPGKQCSHNRTGVSSRNADVSSL
uniref:Uncharacterized protein n=1 Tax=Anguilla anguilla TaxID=7936 RepID=A0A0E9QAI8_ANGAN